MAIDLNHASPASGPADTLPSREVPVRLVSGVRPVRISNSARLEAFPRRGLRLSSAAEILWDRHMVPYIHAAEALDVAYVLGLVHAHLRLSQMEMFKRVSQGRVAEMAGPMASKLDHALRALDLGRAVPEMSRSMDADTRSWIERYVEGVNDHKRLVAPVPPDLRAMGIDPNEAWTIEDVLTFGRLAGADVNWGKWAALLPLRRDRGFAMYVERLRRFSEAGTPTFGPGTPTPLDGLLEIAKTGSNAFAVSPSRSATGSALLAGDPHLGLPQPNLWCIAGYRSPRDSVVGLTFAGLPFVLVGRNEHIAWGGTNMHSLSSVLYDLGGEAGALDVRRERVRQRWAGGKKVRIRESDYGPVISDAPMFKKIGTSPVALRWRGHDASDEAAAMLRIGRATNWAEFRQALQTWATGGQNLVYADRDGNIGQALAIEFVAAAGRAAFEHVVSPSDDRFAWRDPIPSTRLPAALNPDAGFLVSANNAPMLSDPPLLSQANTNDRFLRITQALRENDAVTMDDLRRLQRDVYSHASLKNGVAIAERAGAMEGAAGRVVHALLSWDGCYDKASNGAATYQIVLRHLIAGAYRDAFGRRIVRHLRRGPHVHDFVREDVESERIPAEVIQRAIHRAARAWRPDLQWGEMHLIELSHPLGRVPIFGRKYHFGHLTAGGSGVTVCKASHPVTARTHKVRFGACARHVFDLGDVDESYFVLLGGQDGWIGSECMLDQVAMWESGDMIRVPLRVESQREVAVSRIELTPGT